jgi:hypothetical protein
MIPPDLIVGSAVGGSEIDVLVAAVGLQPKCDANEPARATAGASGRLAGQIHFDRVVTEHQTQVPPVMQLADTDRNKELIHRWKAGRPRLHPQEEESCPG